MICWRTDRNINFLSETDVILCDGTFCVTPKIFYQMYTFHGNINTHKSLPLIYSLLPDKKKGTYLKLANVIFDKCGSLDDVVIVLDFEIGVLKF